MLGVIQMSERELAFDQVWGLFGDDDRALLLAVDCQPKVELRRFVGGPGP